MTEKIYPKEHYERLNSVGKNDEEAKIFYRRMLSQPPYQWCIAYSQSILMDGVLNKPYLKTEQLRESNDSRVEFAQTFLQETDKDINTTLRLLEVEPELIPLLESTDNKLFYRPLFFPTVFVNHDFKVENLIIKGILIVDNINLPLHGFNPHGLINQDLSILFVAVDPEEAVEFYSSIQLVQGKIGHGFFDNEEEAKRMGHVSDFIRRMVVNLIDMVEGNRDELTVTQINVTREQNLKRIKRGKIQMPSKIYIRATGPFKHYVTTFNQNRERTEITHKTLVMGSWRHFNSERYTEAVRGTKKWVKPYYRGEGILICKDYKLTGEVDDE